jgi:cutinase
MGGELSRGKIRGAAFLAVVLCLGVSAFLSAGSPFGAAPAKAIYSCPDVLFLGARGSGEDADVHESSMGPAVNEMARLLGADVGALKESFESRGIQYQAAPVELLYPSRVELAALLESGWTGGASGAAAVAVWTQRHLRAYLASVDDGVAATVKAVHHAIDRCPETELVLAGYSQGAMAVHQAELQLDDESLAAIGGTLLLGDGDRVPGTEAKLIGGAPKSGKGVRTYVHGLRHPQDVAEPETTAEICVSEDIVCDFSLRALKNRSHSSDIHTSFSEHPRSKAELRQAVGWLAQEMGLTG